MVKETYSTYIKNYKNKGTIMVPFESSLNPLSMMTFII